MNLLRLLWNVVQIAAACGGASNYLKPYQVVGINFMLMLARQRVGGSILADEMGTFSARGSPR